MKDLLFQIEKAWDEDILPEFISDYVGSGCGSIKDIETAIKKSTCVTETDYNNAIKYLEMKDMLPNKIDPYKQFVEVYNAGHMYDDFELKNMLTAIYFPHIGNEVWDNAYERIMKNFESLKDQRSDKYTEYKNATKTEGVKKIMNEALDLDIMTVQDMLSAEIDNVSEENLDADIKLYKFIASKLGVKDYDNLYVTVDDGNYNPEWILTDGLMLPYLDYKLFMYPSSKMIAEMNPNGNIFMYFVTEEDAQKYFELADKFLNDFDVQENQFYDDKHAEEWMDRNPHGYYNDESDYGSDVNESVSRKHKRWTTVTSEDTIEECTLSNLEEQLNKRDMLSNNKFDLLNLYLSEAFSMKSRKALVEKINSGATNEELAQLLTLTESEDEDIIPVDTQDVVLDNIDNLPQLTQVNGSAIVVDKTILDNAVDYLISNGIDYDIDSFDDEYRLTWYVGVDAETVDADNDGNKDLAIQMRASLEQVISMLDDIANSSDASRSVMQNKDYIVETLKDVLANCDKFDY